MEGFEQRSDIIYLSFNRIILAVMLKRDVGAKDRRRLLK